jgi:dienelactone hydrolase
MPSTLRFLRQYLRPAESAVTAIEVSCDRDGEPLPATLFRPAGAPRRLPAWVVLHGLTRTGRTHPALTRFAAAIARAGNIVLVPDVPEWRELRVAPAPTIRTIHAAVAALSEHREVRHAHIGLFGFSFGATQALIAAADDGIAGQLSAIAAWGGFCDLRRLFRFGLTGLHDLDGMTYHTRPDPYGAWIMAGNYLPHVPGHEDAGDVARALHALAIESGERGHFAWEPIYDDSKRRLRAGLPPRHRELFDLIAPLTTRSTRQEEEDQAAALELADQLALTALRREPLLDPQPFLPRVRTRTLLAHGRDDRLIPFSESIRLSRQLPRERLASLTVTSLFQHSGGTGSGLGPVGLAREGARFVLLLRRVLRLV